METKPLRIITVAFNPGEELASFAASLPAAASIPYEFVVVDNGEEHSVVDSVADASGAHVVRPGRNLGYGAAANLGAEGFTGTWILVANPDLELTPGAIDALVAGTEEWPRGGAFGPLILTPEGLVYPSARRFPRLVSGAGHALLAGVWPENPFTQVYRANAHTEFPHTVDWLSGACLLLRGRAFREIGGFDGSYFMFFEDTQLGEDMEAAGWHSVFLPQGVVTHEQGSSWKSRPASMLRAHHRSAAHYLDRVYSRPYEAPLRWALRAGLWVRGELMVLRARLG